jgi:hypothetical protein
MSNVHLMWLKRLAIAVALVVVALQWVNSRFVIVWQNQNPSNPVVPTSYRAFHSMATGLHEGRIGQVDLHLLALRDMRVRSAVHTVRTAVSGR